jgi:hypothetical protein
MGVSFSATIGPLRQRRFDVADAVSNGSAASI